MTLANNTEETCTGTGATLALAGATSGNIAFSETFSDGDLVQYYLEDSGGTILVAGLGTYVSAKDDITRNDTWNWNGTVIDDNPSSNITLSGGTHTIRCAPSLDNLGLQVPYKTYLPTSNHYDKPDNFAVHSGATNVLTANKCYYTSIFLARPRIMTSLAVNVTTGDAGATLGKAGLYACAANGSPGKLIESVTIDATTSGVKNVALSSPRKIKAGWYYTAFATNGTPTVTSSPLNIQTLSLVGVTITVPRQYHVTEALSSWSDLPATATPDGFTENYSALVLWK